MKKFLSFALAMLCMLSFVGCGNNSTDDRQTSEPLDKSDLRGNYSNDYTDGNSSSTSIPVSEFISETEIFAEKFYPTAYASSTSPTQASTTVTSYVTTRTSSTYTSSHIENQEKPYKISQSDLDKIASKVLYYVNTERAQIGCPKLSLNSYLNEKASARSTEIMTTFSHTRPNGKSFESVLRDDNYSFNSCSESLACVTYADIFTGSNNQINEIAYKIYNVFKNNIGYSQNIANYIFTKTGFGISYVINSDNSITFYVVELYVS